MQAFRVWGQHTGLVHQEQSPTRPHSDAGSSTEGPRAQGPLLGRAAASISQEHLGILGRLRGQHRGGTRT